MTQLYDVLQGLSGLHSFYGVNGKKYTINRPINSGDYLAAYDHMERMTDDNSDFSEYRKETNDLYKIIIGRVGGNGEDVIMHHPAMVRIKYWLKEWYRWGVGGINYNVRTFKKHFRKPSKTFIDAAIAEDPRYSRGIPIIPEPELQQLVKDITDLTSQPLKQVQDKTYAAKMRSFWLRAFMNEIGENALANPILEAIWNLLDSWVNSATTPTQSLVIVAKTVAAVAIMIVTAGAAAPGAAAILSAGVAAALAAENETAIKNAIDNLTPNLMDDVKSGYGYNSLVNAPSDPTQAGIFGEKTPLIVGVIGAMAFVSLLLIGAKAKEESKSLVKS